MPKKTPLPPGVIKELDAVIDSLEKKRLGSSPETGWDKAAKASLSKQMWAQVDAPGAQERRLKAALIKEIKAKKRAIAKAREAGLYIGPGRRSKKKAGRPAGKRGPGRPKKSGSKMSAKARMAHARSFKGAGHPLSRGPGRPAKHHKGPGRPRKHHAESHRAPKGYNKSRAIARTKLSIKYNLAKLDHLTGVNGTADYRKYGKQLHAMRSKKRKASHRKTR